MGHSSQECVTHCWVAKIRIRTWRKGLCLHLSDGQPNNLNYGAVVKNPPANAGDARDVDSIPGLGRSPGAGNGNPNSMDREAWRATVHGIPKSRPWLSTQHSVCLTLHNRSGNLWLVESWIFFIFTFYFLIFLIFFYLRTIANNIVTHI